jgi:hypothetical protein
MSHLLSRYLSTAIFVSQAYVCVGAGENEAEVLLISALDDTLFGVKMKSLACKLD